MGPHFEALIMHHAGMVDFMVVIIDIKLYQRLQVKKG